VDRGARKGLTAGVVDELAISTAPLVLGGGKAGAGVTDHRVVDPRTRGSSANGARVSGQRPALAGTRRSCPVMTKPLSTGPARRPRMRGPLSLYDPNAQILPTTHGIIVDSQDRGFAHTAPSPPMEGGP
jgi:hypothetical protein